MEELTQPAPALVEGHLADRLKAYAADQGLLCLIAVVAYVFLVRAGIMSESDSRGGELMFLLLNWLYAAALESSPMQATFGKKGAGLVITDLRGARVSFGRALWRNMTKVLSVPLGWGWWAFHNQDGQRFHDWCAGCRVVRDVGPSGRGSGRAKGAPL